MSTERDWIVVGGGFAGIVGAYLLAQKGFSVTLVDRRGLGGVAGGIPWEGFSLDLGCHVFGNTADRTTEILLELLGGEAMPVHMRFASHFGGRTLEGFELPDLSALEDSGQMVVEMARAASQLHPAPQTLGQLLEQRFGATASRALEKAFFKIYQTSSSEVAPQAIYASCFKRVRVVDDHAAAVLKESPALDERIAMGSQDDPMRFYRDCRVYPHRAFYPVEKGMAGFVASARARLEALGVEILVGEEMHDLSLESSMRVRVGDRELHAQQCLWTAGMATLEAAQWNQHTLKDTSHGVPMVLYYFDIDHEQEGPYSYVNDFDAGTLVFRASVPGKYGAGTNCPPGRSYVCCEVPTQLGSDVFVNPDSKLAQVWNEAKALGVVSGEFRRHNIVKTPVSYKVPRADFYAKAAPLVERAKSIACLHLSDEWAFAKNRIIEDLDAIVGQLAPARKAA